jgi:hypothetical protein
VLYPKAPLLDATTGRLTTPCVKALLRIFLMCDSDGVSNKPGCAIDAAFVRRCCLCAVAAAHWGEHMGYPQMR